MENKQSENIFILIVIFILLFPTVDKITSFSKLFPLTERRALATKPKLFNSSTVDFINGYNKYYNDNFGGRNIFIQIYSHIKYFIFKTSPFPELAFIGKDDFVFLGNSTHNVKSSHNGKKLLSKRAIKRITNNVKANNEWSTENGIQYYLCIAPDKHSIYSDKLPSYFNKNLVHRNLDKVVENLINQEIEIIDSRKRLIALKDQFSLYAKTDSHWNDNGAFFCYQDIIRKIGLKFTNLGPEFKRNDFNIAIENSHNKTTTDMINISRYIKENDVNYKQIKGIGHSYKKEKKRIKVPTNYKGLKSIFEDRYTSENKNGLKILVFKDSFTNRLKKFLIPHFEETVFIENFHKFDKDLIKRENPDIILHEIVERASLDYLLNY